jgi:CBS domain-containing protein
MKARDLMVDVPRVGPDDPAGVLVELIGDSGSRVVAVVKDGGEVVGVVTEEDLLSALLPSYVLADRSLARVLEEQAGEESRERLERKLVRDVVDVRRRDRPIVEPEDTLIEVATAMARSNDPGVLVVEEGRVLGVITVGRLLDALLRR